MRSLAKYVLVDRLCRHSDSGSRLCQASLPIADRCQIRSQINALQEKLPGVLNKTARVLGLESGGSKGSVKLEQDGRHGLFFRIARKDDATLRSKGKGYTTLETQKAGVKFTCPELSTLSEGEIYCSPPLLCYPVQLIWPPPLPAPSLQR